MTKKTILIIIAFFLIFKLDAEEDKILKQNEEVINSSQKIIIEINNIEINSESTDKISFRVNDDEKLRVKQIAPEQGEKLFRFLKKNMENEWTSASKLFEKTNTTEYLSLSTGYIPN